MAKQKYEMKTERSKNMDTETMQQLADMRLAPYMQLATQLIGKVRYAGGNMFRHQIDTMGILIDYGYIDSFSSGSERSPVRPIQAARFKTVQPYKVIKCGR